MPELRQDPTTKEWVIIATERGKRPEDFKTQADDEDPETKKTCPFCPGKESRSPGEIFAFRDPGSKPDTPGWKVRVVPNKFPALIPGSNGERHIQADHFKYMAGVGKHEVVIGTPRHEEDIPLMSDEQIELVFLAIQERCKALCEGQNLQHVTIFKNHKQAAGTSLRHPHCQIIATPFAPVQVRHRLETAMSYFDENGECVFCATLEKEKFFKKRIILETDSYIAFSPFASSTPFETQIFLKRHASNFWQSTKEEVKEAAHAVKMILGKMYVGLHNPPYNFVIRSGPSHEPHLEYYHFFIQIIPRITGIAGFELGSGIYINTVAPEDGAEFLREINYKGANNG
ncbi:galactose-1-phosphate uridylyltransferase [Candidatus Saganbacteria bacterium]|nr:galactose-1-phosphate uridylyltransferase [Candidatus Saganbacteria bacterium]